MKRLLLLTLLTTLSLSCLAQKRSLEWDDVRKWNRITAQAITNDGEYIVVETTPWVGDGAVLLYSAKGDELKSFEGGQKPKLLDQNIVVATIVPAKAVVDSLKLAKVKDLPKNKLAIYDIAKGQTQKVDSLHDVKTSTNNGEWLAYRAGEAKSLTITNFGACSATFDNVEEYQFSDEEGYVIFNRFIKDSLSNITIFDLESKGVLSQIDLDKSQKIKRLSVGKGGEAAYIVVGKDKSGSENEIYYWNGATSTKIDISGVQAEWIVNENMTPRFAKESSRLYFGISPQYPVADTTILESEKPKVDVWIWNEPKLKTQQIVDYDRDIKKAYKVVYNTQSTKLQQIETAELPDSELLFDSGDGDLALVGTSVPYLMESMWSGERRRDVYIKNIESGEQRELLKGENVSVRVSPDAEYLYWYTPRDSAWYAYSVKGEQLVAITTPTTVEAYNAMRNVPDLPTSYGVAGWGEGDKIVYIYDKYDIWAVDPSGKAAPSRLTDGYKSDVTYRIARIESDKKSFAANEKVLLEQFNQESRQSGFASLSLNKPSSLKSLVMGDYRYGTPTKAKDSNTIIFTRENFQEFPNLYVANLDFKKPERVITDANPQQSQFLWGSVESVSWVSFGGDTLRGSLFKPENFDPTKKYPMICNFYERDSENLFAHRIPEVHRSSIDYHYYTSNGYVIFNPDIKYVDGYPGESCFNCLMPGVTKVLEMGFVDAARIGAQGHSWGGYQVAYLATRTDLFAAIESGAPVVNMISAYGGIRWASGLNRAFQYEHGQSRIGASPWEAPARYTENSPIYTMDKVNTPILIMHNDHDGHVPWWQGIEYFVALRRLEKPVWMLNYNGEPHWPTTAPNKFDFQTKMSQFFNHYLKGDEMPEWMK